MQKKKNKPVSQKFSHLTLERGMCYGTCPVYTVAVTADGKVEWTGEHFVKEIGHAFWSISKSRMSLINKVLHEACSRYKKGHPECYTDDLASCNIIVEYPDKSVKNLEHDFGDHSVPEVMFALENRLDRLIGTAKYIGKDKDRM